MWECTLHINFYSRILQRTGVAVILCGKALPTVCTQTGLQSNVAWENMCEAPNRRGVEKERVGENGRRGKGRAW